MYARLTPSLSGWCSSSWPRSTTCGAPIFTLPFHRPTHEYAGAPEMWPSQTGPSSPQRLSLALYLQPPTKALSFITIKVTTWSRYPYPQKNLRRGKSVRCEVLCHLGARLDPAGSLVGAVPEADEWPLHAPVAAGVLIVAVELRQRVRAVVPAPPNQSVDRQGGRVNKRNIWRSGTRRFCSTGNRTGSGPGRAGPSS